MKSLAKPSSELLWFWYNNSALSSSAIGARIFMLYTSTQYYMGCFKDLIQEKSLSINLELEFVWLGDLIIIPNFCYLWLLYWWIIKEIYLNSLYIWLCVCFFFWEFYVNGSRYAESLWWPVGYFMSLLRQVFLVSCWFVWFNLDFSLYCNFSFRFEVEKISENLVNIA